MNGLIGEVESLIGLIIEILGNNHEDDLAWLNYVSEVVTRMLGFMVVVPSNPEDQYFILVDGMLSLVDDENSWTADKAYKLRCDIYLNVVRFLASQTQEKLPYRLKFVNSNDQIFSGNEEFAAESNRMMDFCFQKVLEIITKLNE